ncbi:MAG: hypothetical protein L0H53_11980 [Candidatus Nitrosocosmicus sp.]|nr:hypothetical protein [Candidatus Nitrosocosmicus sp.]MDN5868893.1 hypothetical protein [Candidatus Nitrosocosmicus sp.]
MSRKGSKNFSEGEKKVLISVINDYEVCDLSDKKMIEILSQKLGRGIKETSYYALKSKTKKNKLTPEEWLDNFCRFGGIAEFYERRFQELLYVQRELIKLYADEANKKDTVTKQNRTLMAKLAKTTSDNSKNLSELGIGSPVITAKLQSLIPKEILNGDLEYTEKYFEKMSKDEKLLWSIDSDENKILEDAKKNEVKLDPSKAPTALLHPIDNLEEKDKTTEVSDPEDDQRIF